MMKFYSNFGFIYSNILMRDEVRVIIVAVKVFTLDFIYTKS